MNIFKLNIYITYNKLIKDFKGGDSNMRKNMFRKGLLVQIIILLLITYFAPLSTTKMVDVISEQNVYINEGQILFSPMQSTTTYLIDNYGDVIHTWPSDYLPGESVYMLGDGSILRTIKLSFSEGGAGGGIQKIAWEGDLIWDFRYYTDDHLSHHDIEILPNSNILMIAWEHKTHREAIEAGRDPDKLISNSLEPGHVIEVKPTGPTSGDIVWEWHVWDHLIQDFDSSKDNYGVVEDHPELIDINFGVVGSDWLHINSIDYNENFDQILLSVKHFDEIWVIDHSTTIDEAANHSGGNSGQGGDILYRWGNPLAYRAGIINDQVFYRQHDARWIRTGYPGEGNILVFNNMGGFPNDFYSTVDEIVPPVDKDGHYYLEPGSAYEPDEQIWRYNIDFFALLLGGVQRIQNGNTIICTGAGGKFLEVTPDKQIVWEYENPYPNQYTNNVFKFVYYPPGEPPAPNGSDLDCIGSLEWNNVKAGEFLNGNFQVKNIGNAGSLLNWSIKSFPGWGNWSFDPESGVNLMPENGPLTIQVSVVAPIEVDKKFEGYITVENQEDSGDYDVIPVYLKTQKVRTINNPFLEFLSNHHNLFPLL